MTICVCVLHVYEYVTCMFTKWGKIEKAIKLKTYFPSLCVLCMSNSLYAFLIIFDYLHAHFLKVVEMFYMHFYYIFNYPYWKRILESTLKTIKSLREKWKDEWMMMSYRDKAHAFDMIFERNYVRTYILSFYYNEPYIRYKVAWIVEKIIIKEVLYTHN